MCYGPGMQPSDYTPEALERNRRAERMREERERELLRGESLESLIARVKKLESSSHTMGGAEGWH